jgi:hypothetical protein
MTSTESVSSDSTGNPLVTIAIPTFNRATWLKGCVHAALAQTYQNFEILVSDNASTDETAEVLQEITDHRLRVIRQKSNIGFLPNWQTCVAEAKGEYVVFVADDDLIAPWFLDRCVALIRKEPKLPIVVTLADIHFIAEDRIQSASTNRRYGTGIWDGADILREFFAGRISIQMCGVLFRTEVIRAGPGFRLDFHYTADLACWGPILVAGRAGFINESCGTFRAHGTAQTSDFSDDVLLNDVRAVADLITSKADSAIDGKQKRGEIKASARLYVALSAIYRLTLRRKAGATAREVVPILWQWRRDLAGAGLRNALTLAKPLGFLLLPEPVACFLRSCARMLRLTSAHGRRRGYSPSS